MTQPGWYPDPSGGDGKRYWDGHQWSAVAVPPPEPPKPSRVSKRDRILLTALLGVVAVIGVFTFSFKTVDEDKKADSPRSSTTESTSIFGTAGEAPPATVESPPSTPDKTALTDMLSPSELKDAQFMAVILANDIPFDDREDILATGQGVCLYLDVEGKTTASLLVQLMKENPDMTPEQIGTLARAAMDVWCPERVPEG